MRMPKTPIKLNKSLSLVAKYVFIYPAMAPFIAVAILFNEIFELHDDVDI